MPERVMGSAGEVRVVDDETPARDGPATGYGFPPRFWRWLEGHRPPGVGVPRVWRSSLRGPWLTSVFGSVLLVVLPVVIVTGLFSYIAYGPQFGQAYPGDVGLLRLPGFDWPAHPSWLYRLNQGLHVGLGLVVVPVVLAKLWSVVPKLFVWPPARSIAQVLERVSLLALVGGILFEIVTGVLNIQYDYIFGFSFYTAHYYGAWVFISGFVVHVAIKLPTMVAALRSRSLAEVLSTSRADTVAEPPEHTGLAPTDPAEATMSRRDALSLVAGGSLLVFALSAGQSIGGVTTRAALLLPRGRQPGDGPNGFQVNKTVEAAGIHLEDLPTLTLRLTGGAAPVTLDRAALLAMTQHSAVLPIACVEGWSTTQRWAGVRLADLARLAGVPRPASARVESVQQHGAFRAATLQANQILAADALLALKVNGVDLAPDHGYPARVIVPALPGVHCTKWVSSIDFRSA